MLDLKKLKAGDILLCRVKPESHFTSKFIVFGQKLLGRSRVDQNYCHVAIIDKDTTFLYEARWPKTRRWRIDWDHLDKYYSVEHWRVRGSTPAKTKVVLAWLNEHLGEWYDLPLFLFGWIDFKHAEVCSTYLVNAWAQVNVNFQPNVSYGKPVRLITPDEIASNSKLIRKIQ